MIRRQDSTSCNPTAVAAEPPSTPPLIARRRHKRKPSCRSARRLSACPSRLSGPRRRIGIQRSFPYPSTKIAGSPHHRSEALPEYPIMIPGGIVRGTDRIGTRNPVRRRFKQQTEPAKDSATKPPPPSGCRIGRRSIPNTRRSPFPDKTTPLAGLLRKPPASDSRRRRLEVLVQRQPRRREQILTEARFHYYSSRCACSELAIYQSSRTT